MSDNSPIIRQSGEGRMVREGKHDCPCCNAKIDEEQASKSDGFVEVGAICQDDCGWSQYTVLTVEPFRDTSRKRITIPEGWVYLLCHECEMGELVEVDSYASQHAGEIDSPCCGGDVEKYTDEYSYGY